MNNSRFNAACLVTFLIGTISIISGCSKDRDDLVMFSNKDKSLEVGFFKDTAIMNDDDDDHVLRVGVRGIKRMKGRTDTFIFGIECKAGGGSIAELATDLTKKDDLVLFSMQTWERGGGKFIDHLAEEGCKIGLTSSD